MTTNTPDTQRTERKAVYDTGKSEEDPEVLPASKFKVKRIFAFLVDALFLFLLTLIVFSVAVYPIAQTLDSFNQTLSEYDEARGKKTQFLSDLGLMSSSDGEAPNGIAPLKSEDELFADFIQVYITDQKDETWTTSDKIANFYINEIGSNERLKFSDTSIVKMTWEKYFEKIIVPAFNTDKAVFVWKEELAMPKINEELMEGQTVSCAQQLRNYFGIDINGNKAEKQQDDDSVSFYKSMVAAYQGIRHDAFQLAITSTEDLGGEGTEEIINQKYADLQLYRSSSLMIAFSISFIILEIGLPFLLRGRSAGKACFGIYIVDTKNKDYPWYKMLGRNLIRVIPLLWALFVNALLTFSGNIAIQPMFSFGVPFWAMAIFSVAVALLSWVVTLFTGENALSIHDLIFHTRAVKFSRGYSLQDYYEDFEKHQKEEEEKKKHNDCVEGN